MSSQQVRSNDATASASVASVDMKLEVVVIPVSDVDRAKEFYSRLGWRLDADRAPGSNFRLFQFTPPGSGSSLQFRHEPHVGRARFGSGPAFWPSPTSRLRARNSSRTTSTRGKGFTVQ